MMIAPLIGLQTAVAMSHYSLAGMLSFGARGIAGMTKSAQLNYANNAIMYKIFQNQEEYYRKLLHKNIKRSFSTFA